MEQTIKWPLPGIFYRRPNPDADPYVSEGASVQAGDVVGPKGSASQRCSAETLSV